MITLRKALYIGAITLSNAYSLSAAEALLKGLEKAYPIARRTLSTLIMHDPAMMLAGLERSAPIANRVLTNCISKLPDDNPVKIYAGTFSGNVKKLKEMVDAEPEEHKEGFMATFPGSSLDRSMRQALDELRVIASLHPEIRKDKEYKDAYQNIEKISDEMGLNATAFEMK